MDDITPASDLVEMSQGDLNVAIGNHELMGILKSANSVRSHAKVMDVTNIVLYTTNAIIFKQQTLHGSTQRKLYQR